MEIVFLLVTFIIGIHIGSFLCVLVDRLPRGEQVLHGRSHCEACGRTLKPLDLLPLVSYIALRGKCRYCHTKLSFFYPLIEAVTGLTFAGAYWYVRSTGGSPDSLATLFQIVYLWIVAAALIVVFFADLRFGIIPDLVVFPTIGVVLLYRIGQWLLRGNSPLNPLLCALFLVGLFLAIVVITHGRGMGLGDVKFVAIIGLFLGYPLALFALYISFLTGACLGVILVLNRKKKIKQTIAFGPFLVIGMLAAYLWSNQLILFWHSFIS